LIAVAAVPTGRHDVLGIGTRRAPRRHHARAARGGMRLA
jgi:hypothetical protein